MKSLVVWCGVVGVLSSSVVIAATHEGVDAYRQGYYFKAGSALSDDSGHEAVADYYLGRMYWYGYGVLKNNALALRYFKRAAERGFLPAIRIIALEALNRNNDPVQALVWFKKAADANEVSAQMYCAAAYHVGFGTSINEDMARRYSILAAKNGNARAQYVVAEYFLSRRDMASQRLGVAWLNKALEQESVPAALKLSELYSEGKVVSKDLEKAQNLLDWTATHGGHAPVTATANSNTSNQPVVPAEAMARWLSDNQQTSLQAVGYGVDGLLNAWHNAHALEENNYNQAPQLEKITRDTLFKPRFEMMNPMVVSLVHYYRAYLQSVANTTDSGFNFPTYPVTERSVTLPLIEKAILGDSTVQFQLGQCYEQGIGVEKNRQQALVYYKKAAAQQELRAEYNLGLLYLQGDKPDYSQSMAWLNDAAFKGNAEAQYALAQIAERGYVGVADDSGKAGIPPNQEQAMAMYYLAAASHQPQAQYRLATILMREPEVGLTVKASRQREALLRSLYAGAAAQGVHEAELPLAFFDSSGADGKRKEAAFALARQQAGAGNAAAALLLGLLYDRGIGTHASRTEAIEWYKKSGNNPSANFILGTYFAEGQGLAVDLNQAEALLQQATQAGFSYAPLQLAVLSQQQSKPFLDNLLQAYNSGNAQASLLLADYYLTLNDDVTQMQQARVIYQQLAEKGNAEAQWKLGYLFENGLGGVMDRRIASGWYTEAAHQGDALAQYRLGRLHQMGWFSGQPDYAEAKKWYTAAMQQYMPAAVALGFIHETVEDNYTRALKNYVTAASRGDAVGQFNLGLMYEKGKGVDFDASKAAAAYLAAANQGHVQAMVQLAGLYLNGQMGARDEAIALIWYKKAASRGDRDALYQLGLLSETGIGMRFDYTEALHFYQEAARKAHAKAMLALARMYQYGLGVEKNNTEAIALYKQLATRGNAYAAYQLAVLAYADQLGASSRQQTKQWLELARINGSQQASLMLQWINAQTDWKISFIEPVVFQARGTRLAGEPAHWIYFGVLNEWNQGNEGDSRRMLGQLLKEYPNYGPAKEAFTHLNQPVTWTNS